MAITFLLLTVLVQASTALAARSAADAAVAASVRRLSLPGSDLAGEERRLTQTLESVVPGAAGVSVHLFAGPTAVWGTTAIEWRPPGPLLVPITLHSRAEVPRAIPP